MCGEHAPTGKIIQAGKGHFSVAAIFNNEDLVFGADVTYEDLLEKREQLLDMSQATEGWSYARKMRKLMKEKSGN